MHDNLLLPSISGRSVGPGRREGLGTKGIGTKMSSVEWGLVVFLAVGFVLVPRGAGAKKHEARMMHYGDRRC